MSRKLLFCILIIISILSMVHAQDSAIVILSWQPNNEPDLSHYRLRFALIDSEWNFINVGNTNRYYLDSLKFLSEYQFSLTAIDEAGNESLPSDTVYLKTGSYIKSDFDNNGSVNIHDLIFFTSQWGIILY